MRLRLRQKRIIAGVWGIGMMRDDVSRDCRLWKRLHMGGEFKVTSSLACSHPQRTR